MYVVRRQKCRPSAFAKNDGKRVKSPDEKKQNQTKRNEQTEKNCKNKEKDRKKIVETE